MPGVSQGTSSHRGNEGSVAQNGQGLECQSELPIPPEHSGDRPLGVGGAIKKLLIDLHNDEVSKSDPFAALSMGPRVMELVLGERPGGGVALTHFSSTPHLHLSEAPLASTLQNLATIEEKLGEAIADYQIVSGVTPSRAALGVLSIVLRKMNRGDREVCAGISTLCSEARALDLTTSEKTEWSKATPLKVGGKDVMLEVTLVELSSAFRGLVGALQVDVPKEDRGNRCGFNVTLRLAQPTETEALRRFKSLERQMVAIPGFLAPLIGTEVALQVFSIPSTVASLFSGNGLLSSVVQNGLHFSCLIAAGFFSFSLYTRINEFRNRGERS